MGRAALDEDAIRMLEELNPDVEFDWTRMLKAEPPQESPPTGPGQERRRGGQRQQPSRREREADRRPPPPAAAASEPVPADVEPIVSAAEPVTERAIDFAPVVPDQVEESPTLMPSAAQARLGTEGVVRLRGRYAEVLARIDERIPDPVRREELKGQAERLNPDNWVTDDEVRAGLEQYEAAFESLRAVVGRRRKRRRRRGARPQSEAAAKGTEAQDADEAEEPGESDDL